MVSLYTLAERNIRKTFLLLFIFLVLIIFFGWVISEFIGSYFILILAVIYSVGMVLFSYWYSDKIVLKMTKARKIDKKDNPELYRIVENLCISAGLPLPQIYIIDEQQPNAFATGRDPKHSAVAFTKGLLEKLERVEIEGVVAHELSHIKNRDILLSSIVVVLVGIIALLSRFFLRISFFGMGGRRKREGGLILFLIAIIAAILAPLAATLIRLAISRKREFLADASGALLTRYPEGLARALEKISKDQNPMRVADNSTAHLFIASPFKGKEKTSWFTKLFMTHPPIEERIKALRGMKI